MLVEVIFELKLALTWEGRADRERKTVWGVGAVKGEDDKWQQVRRAAGVTRYSTAWSAAVDPSPLTYVVPCHSAPLKRS